MDTSVSGLKVNRDHRMRIRSSYIEACLKVIKSITSRTTRNLDSTLSNLVRGEGAVVDAGETVMAIILGHGSGTEGHLTEGICQTVRRGRLSDCAMGRTGLGNMSDLGNAKIWDRIGLEGAYTAMKSFTLNFRNGSSGNATTCSVDGRVNGLWRFHLTRSEASSGRRQRRACPIASRSRNGERVMLTFAVVRGNLEIKIDASFHLRCFTILATDRIILMSWSNTDLEATLIEIDNVFRRERGQVSRGSVMMRHVSQRVRAASSHAGASN